jgi:hypothetical protein
MPFPATSSSTSRRAAGLKLRRVEQRLRRVGWRLLDVTAAGICGEVAFYPMLSIHFAKTCGKYDHTFRVSPIS